MKTIGGAKYIVNN